MKVLLLNTKDSGGGAVQATLRLHEGLLSAGVDSRLLVQNKDTTNRSILGPDSIFNSVINGYRSRLDSLPVRRYRDREPKAFSPSFLPDNVQSRIREMDLELLHLNWIAGAFLQIETLGEFDQPLVWTMHDMWPFTGGCHFSYNCERYTEGCGDCPILRSDDLEDLSKRVWDRKADAWADIDPTLVAPSNWLADCARKSKLFDKCRVERIPYGLDLTNYRNLDPATGRELFDLPSDAQIILFGANSSSPRKGYRYLVETLGTLEERASLTNIELAVFGPYDDDTKLDFPVHELGYLDETRLRLAYAASDVFVIPSTQDNLPNVTLESMAAGTPCVAFDIGGLSDMIDHKMTGYLAEPFDTTDLADGVEFVLDTATERMATRSREKIAAEFDIRDVVEQYRNLYDELI